MSITDIAVDFGFWNQCRHRVNNNYINCSTSDQNLGNFQGLFSIIRLRNQKIIHINAEPAGIIDIKSMFRIDKCRYPVTFLSLGNDMKGQGGFPRCFRAIYFCNPSSGDAVDPAGNIKA